MKTRIRLAKLFLYSFLALSIFSFTSCDDDGISFDDLNLFSTADDVTLGTQLDAEINANSKEYPMLNNASATAYLQGIVDQITNSPEIKYKNIFKYKVQIINTNTINAFATPGGFVYVYKGLIKYLDNEASIAAVLGHEIAHAELRHSTQRMTKQYGVSTLLSILLGDDSTSIQSIAANMLSGLALLKNSRDDEYEADEYSLRYLRSTSWYPAASTYFFDKIKKDESGGTLAELLSTHPFSEDRITAINKLITKYNIAGPSESNLFTTRYSIFKNGI